MPQNKNIRKSHLCPFCKNKPFAFVSNECRHVLGCMECF